MQDFFIKYFANILFYDKIQGIVVGVIYEKTVCIWFDFSLCNWR